MIAIELLATATSAVDHVLHPLASTPLAEPAPKGINTNGVVSFFASKIAPILLAVLGVIFIGRASRGEISKVLTSSAIAIIGLAFIAGAATLFFVGDYLIDLIFE
ncbi:MULTISPECIES: hypothetical protein [unclassified Micromonospora]|uniref:hypothetical protein n=1 Tax=unclassified Micromonospora TaxID=2617518 RepID=UPI0006272B47|nr:hypothetical protein [Micromonospora sp. HK10]KKK04802.1 hypothetical protein LQ51_17470 [Micromonospora sp. HK10]